MQHGLASNILTAQTNNPSDPNYQNLYYTQIGGRGVVFITNKATPAVSPAAQTGGVHTADLVFAFTNANVLNGKTIAASTGGDVLINTVVEQRESSYGTENTVNSYLGTSMPIANTGTNNGNAAELSFVQTTPSALGYVDAGYTITGGVASTTPASGIIILNVTDSSSGSPVTYVPSHANIKNSLKDWYYQHAQDNTGRCAKNYPQGLVGGLYWITKGTAPTASTNGIVTTPGTNYSTSVVTNLINFAKSPTEATAYKRPRRYVLALRLRLKLNHNFFLFSNERKTRYPQVSLSLLFYCNRHECSRHHWVYSLRRCHGAGARGGSVLSSDLRGIMQPTSSVSGHSLSQP